MAEAFTDKAREWGITVIESQRLSGAEEFLAVLCRHRHFKAIICGASSCIITCYTTGQVKNRIIIYRTVVRQNDKIDD